MKGNRVIQIILSMENASTVAYMSSDLQRSESQLQEDAGCLFVPQGSLATGPREWGEQRQVTGF